MPVQFTTDPLPITNRGERHIAAVILVDISGSMQGAPINELNQGLIEFGNALQVCIISFNSSVQTEMSFRPAAEYEAPVLGQAV